MSFSGWRICTRFTAVLVAFGVAAHACAQVYPNKPVRLVVPFVPGGGTDLIARTLSSRLTEVLGQSVVVDNRAGAGGVIGADLAAKALPDGYTLLMGTPGPLTINPALIAKMPYTLADFAPIALTTISPFMLVVHPAVPAKSVKDPIALAPAKTPRAIVTRLNRELDTIVRNSEVKERFFAQGPEVIGGTPEQYAQHLRDELALNSRIIKAAGIKPD